MKKFTFLFSLFLIFMGATGVFAQTYVPTNRATKLEPGKQYMIYDANLNGKRWAFRGAGDATLTNTQIKPWAFSTTDATWVWTLEEITPEKTAENKFYLKSNNATQGYASGDNSTNNASGVELTIAPAGTSNAENQKAELEDGSTIAGNADITPEMGLFVISGAAGTWNGVEANGGQWANWSPGHPYAFYEVKTVPADLVTAYESLKELAQTVTADYFALQTAYGLVKDGETGYFSNKPETDPNEHSSYANLVDGTFETYFHSSWSNTGSDAHFLQADLGTAVEDFYFYIKKRHNNDVNRPVEILVSGSNSADGAFTEIATISHIPTEAQDYISYKISSEIGYQHIRFTVKKTNSDNTIFFTASEFYVLPSNEATDEAALRNVDQFNPLYNEVTIDQIEAQKAHIGMIFTKKQVKELLETNADNHSAIPTFGQYATADYNALNAAYEACTTPAGLDALMSAMKAFVPNYPVFTINSNQKSYGIGQSVYDDGRASLHFKTKNVTDKQMLWIFETTSTTIGAGTYVVKNMATGNNFWGADNIVVYDNATPHVDGVFTFKTNGTGNEVHAQQSGAEVVRWGAKESDGGSAWTFTYVGEYYEINEVFKNMSATYGATAAAAMQIYGWYADAANDAYYGNKTGQYPASYKTGIADALNGYTSLVGTATNELELYMAGITEEQLANAKTAIETTINAAKPNINMPKDGEAFVLMNVHEQNQKALQVDVVTWSTCLYSDCNTAVIEDVDLSFVYICNKMEDGQYALASNTGKYLAFKGVSSNTSSANGNKGYTDVYDEKFSHLTIEPGQRFGCFAIKGHETGRQVYFIRYNRDGDVFNQSTSQVSRTDQYYSSDFRFIEYPSYPNAPQLNAVSDIEGVEALATFSAPFATVAPEGVTAYIATESADKSYVTMTELEGAVPANTGVVLAGVAGKVTMVPAAGELQATVEGNLLGHSAGAAKDIPAEENAYVLTGGEDGVAFYRVSATNRTLGMNKAYLVLNETQGAVKMSFGAQTTGLEQTEVQEGAAAAPVFDLSGRRVMQAVKGGVYIQNGKKFIVK